MKKLLIILLSVFSLLFAASPAAYSDQADIDYLELRSIDAGTFNTYRYLIGQKYLELNKGFQVDGTMEREVLIDIAKLAKTGKNYLPNNLTNDNLFNNLVISLEKWSKQASNSNNFKALSDAIQAYLENADIGAISGEIVVTPNEGPAPHNTSLRAQVVDPSGSRLENYNYTWWIDASGQKTIIWNGPSINYTFSNEGTFGVFLDVTSNHKNAAWYTDVLPLRQKTTVKVNEKIASVILNVNNNKVVNNGVVKVSPSEAEYGIIFDATSSTPSNGSQFQQTLWDFGNGVKREYRGWPKIERVQYSSTDIRTVTLSLVTNEWNIITRQFDIIVSQPIAEIKTSSKSGFLGDTFTFLAKGSDQFEGLNYNWEIIDIQAEKIIYKKSGTSFSYIFPNKGRYNIQLRVWNGANTDVDTTTIYINSRPPVAQFTATTPDSNIPNRVLLDGTRSHDPDFSDDGRLEYAWIINGERVQLEQANDNNSRGYYTFDSIGSQSVVLAVVDPDNMSHQKQDKVQISSLLGLDFVMNPNVAQRDSVVNMTASSKYAVSFDWDFGDGNSKTVTSANVSHSYKKSWSYQVRLTVRDKDNLSNTHTKTIYIGDVDDPYAQISLEGRQNMALEYQENACLGESAYIANKVDPIQFSGRNSIDVTGVSSGLEYSWKLGNSSFFSTPSFSHQFDEVGCFPVKLTVKSQNNGKTHSQTIYVKVENILPTLSSLNVQVLDGSTDPVIVNVSAQGAVDRDGVIQSYLWYYYTDADNQPQDFSSTTQAQTTFVLPKITGNYYFVVVMKDSNEQRVNSEEVTGEKFFITLSWDNVNTPLIDISLSDSSVSIGEEVVYTVDVENILWQDISENAEYAWDFDGDGFYEKQWKQATISHIFQSSGEFHSKVKVKNKGFSNVKTVTINVANRLVADFDYISIGHKFVFINTSQWEIDSISWDLWDGNTSSVDGTFTHVYSDGERSHDVTMTITEAGKKKEITKTVQWNPRNILESRKTGLNVFTNPDEAEKNQLVLDTPTQNVYVYLAESEENIAYFSIDYDIDYDSDLNGGSDDDEDNRATSSYDTWAPAKIELNGNRSQKVAITWKNADGVTLEVYELEIIKSYISLEAQNAEDIIFSGVTHSEKEKIQQLKDHLVKLDANQRVKAMKYLAKLQEEWFDHTEKTRVIIEFEQYIATTGYKNSDNVIDILESLLVEWQEDKSDQNITYRALVSLIPNDISCNTESEISCQNYLISLIEDMKNSGDIEQNRATGSQLLSVVAETNTMTDQQKLDFKQILKTFIYGGLENVPEVEIVDTQTPSSSWGFMTAVKTLFKWLWILVAVIVIVIVLFWLYYKIKNKDENTAFQDFIIDKTRNDESSQKVWVAGDVLQGLAWAEAKQPSASEKQSSSTSDTPAASEPKTSATKDIPTPNKQEVPDWLKGSPAVSQDLKNDDSKQAVWENSWADTIKQDVSEPPKAPIDTKKELDTLTQIEPDSKASAAIPDWLQGAVEQSSPSDTKTSWEKEVSWDLKKDDIPVIAPDKTPAEETKTANKVSSWEDENIPDWLKGAVWETKTDAPSWEKWDTKWDKKSEEKPLPATPKKETSSTKDINNDALPDWLKGSMDEEKVGSAAPEDPINKLDTKVSEDPLEDTVNKPAKKIPAPKKAPAESKTKTPKKPASKASTKKVATAAPKKPKKEAVEATKKTEAPALPAEEKSPTKKSAAKKPATPPSKTPTSGPKDDSQESKKANKKSWELWDDGMDVPDWLRWEDTK